MVAPIVAGLARGAANGTAKQAAKNAAKQPRAKTQSDIRYNERRRAKRLAARLEKQSQLQSGSSRQETLKHVQRLKEAIDSSYIDKTSHSYNRAVGQLEQLTKPSREYNQRIKAIQKESSLQENLRITRMQENYFRSASKTKEQREADIPRTPDQYLARAEQSFFYGVTRHLWLNAPEAERNNIIVNRMQNMTLESGRRVQNLQDAFQWVKENYKDEFPTLESVMKDTFDTDLDSEFSREVEQEAGSPPTKTISEWKALGAVF